MKVIYIVGKFRGPNHWEVEQNIRRAEALALEVWRAGFACICPHTNTRFFDGAALDSIWLEGDIEIMSRCDAVLTVNEGLEDSVGSRLELAVCEAGLIPVFRTLDALVEWQESWRSKT